jgi:CheY-like chemotaxis protein
MPHLDGRGVFEELLLRGHPLLRRIIFVTGDVLSPKVAEFLQTSEAPFLAKPFFIEELREIVNRTLQRMEAVPVAPAGGRAPIWSRMAQKGRRGH